MVLKTDGQKLQDDIVLGLLARGAPKPVARFLAQCKDVRVTALRDRLPQYLERQLLGL